MRSKVLFRFIGVLFLLFVTIQMAYCKPSQILILNSYHTNLSWSQSIIKGISAEFNDHFDQPYDLFIEDLDSKRFVGKHYEKSFVKYLKEKYQSSSIDLIIANDDNAFDFLVQYKHSLFGDIPVVMSGLNFNHNYPPEYTGIKEEIEICENFELIQRLHPDLEQLYIIVDNTNTGQIIRKNILQAYKAAHCDFNTKFLTEYSFKDLKEKIVTLGQDDAIFLTTFNRDKDGKYHSYDEVITGLRSVASVPMYGVWDFYLGKGIVGGKIIDGFEHGKEAAAIAIDILTHSKKPSDIPVHAGPLQFQFDYNEMKQFDISLSNLPEDALIINNPYEIIRENRNLIIAVLLLIAVLIVLVIVLFRYNHVKKQRLIEQNIHIDEMKEVNKNLEEAKKIAEKGNQLKTSFLSNISHEIRTPLNSIMGFTRLLANDHSESDEKRAKYYEMVQMNSKILLNVINDIIDLSFIETNQLQIHYADFDMHAMLQDMCEFTKQEIEHKSKSRLEVNLEKGVNRQSFYVKSDESRLRQVFMHLVRNAVKFSYSGTITLGYRLDGETILFFVKDQGIGIDHKQREQIFDRFRRVNHVNTRKFEGAGLGLALSKGIIDNMNGKMWLESQYNKGADFYFQIPLIPSGEQKQDSHSKVQFTSEKAFNWAGKKILIVEDSRMAHELIKKLLRGTHAEFELETDGKSAVERCKKDESIDLVLMDIQLPFVDGYTATRQIKETRPDLPVIAQTANAMSDDRNTALQAGCDDYIAKPIDREELSEKIDTLLFPQRNS